MAEYDRKTALGHIEALFHRGRTLAEESVRLGGLEPEEAYRVRLHHRLEAIEDALRVLAADFDGIEAHDPDRTGDQ